MSDIEATTEETSKRARATKAEIQALSLRIIDALHAGPAGISELAASCESKRSTVSAALKSLAKDGKVTTERVGRDIRHTLAQVQA